VPSIRHIVIHCSDSPHGRGDDAETIHRWHLERGWAGIGYHYVICEDGELQYGRPEYWMGAHVSGHNEGSLGVCLIGVDSFTAQQFETLQDLVRELNSRYPDAVFVGHRDLDPGRSCPNFDIRDIVDAALE